MALLGALAVVALGAPAVFGDEGAGPGSAVQLRYRESGRMDVAPGANKVFSLRCPRGWKAIEGYFDSDGGIFEFRSTPGTLRRWDFGVVNLTSNERSVSFGIICIKGVGVPV
jgi:hypothetical protein